MDPRNVRPMSLDMPGTAVKLRHGREVFSVKKKTYITLWAEADRAVLKFNPAQQASLCALDPDLFSPVSTNLGRHGWTNVDLVHIGERTMRYVIDLAWRNVAPKWLALTREAPPRA